MKKFTVGDRVYVNGSVYSTTNHHSNYQPKELIGKVPDTQGIHRIVVRQDFSRWKPKELCMILGWTTRQTGTLYFPPNEDMPGYLNRTDTVTVWMVMPIDPHDSSRYRKPFICIEDQMSFASSPTIKETTSD